jgi:Na+-transporting methylmalonyl-CoA/oxaloacetate decarboxylase gamma subunit
MKLLGTVALVLAVGVAVVMLNLVLLGSASSSNDPVGKLVPRAHLPAPPHGTVRPQHGPLEGEGRDD